MQEVLVNRLGGLSLPRKSVVRLTDRPDMTSDVYRGRKTTIQQYNVKNDVTLCKFDVNVKNQMAVAGSIGFFILEYKLFKEKGVTLLQVLL